MRGRLEIRQGSGVVVLEWPLWPRVRPYVLALAAGVAWPAIAFPLATALGLELPSAAALALGPPMLVLVAGAAPLAAELGSRRLVLRRVPGGIAVGAVGPLAADALTVAVRERRRWLRRPRHGVRLLAKAQARRATVELVVVDELFATRGEAEAFAAVLRGIIGHLAEAA